jgi:8-oxo-dGTP pyrophosphatase MutT (NUDIX family)
MEELARYDFQIHHRPGTKMAHADYLSRINQVVQPEFRRDATFVMNILYNDKGIYLSQRSKDAKVMAGQLQVPGGKVDAGETSIEAAIRETLEETNLKVKPIYWSIDHEFNTDIYLCKLRGTEWPEWTEKDKNGP